MDAYLVNTTFAVDLSAVSSWLKWSADCLLPFISRQTGCKACMFKVMAVQDGSESYCVMFHASLQSVRLWKSSLDAEVQKMVRSKFGSASVGFSTVLKEVASL